MNMCYFLSVLQIEDDLWEKMLIKRLSVVKILPYLQKNGKLCLVFNFVVSMIYIVTVRQSFIRRR